MGPPDRVRVRFRQAEQRTLPAFYQVGHGADSVLDRHVWIDPVLVVEVNDLHAEALERSIAGAAHIIRAAVDAVRPAGILGLAKLGREDDLVPDTAESPPEHAFIVAPPVHVRAIEMVDPVVDGRVNEVYGRGIVRLAIDTRQ